MLPEFLLLLSLWPFHHKKPQLGIRVPSGCSVRGDAWFYAGDDGFIGIGASCDAAKKDWRTMHIDPVRMSRS